MICLPACLTLWILTIHVGPTFLIKCLWIKRLLRLRFCGRCRNFEFFIFFEDITYKSARLLIHCYSWWFIHSDHFYSVSSSQLLLRSASDIARLLCRSFTWKRHRQLWVKDLPKVPTWRLERESNTRPFGWKASTQPMRHHVPLLPNTAFLISLFVHMC